ncbi:hypothetical protein B0J12DRAFT_52964 [Macrophomina phaseolina]|uniref:PAS domain-containing protein n=1 Tax=Macrophomina phaseolina TaxID=35725 RepID=A0ABQ8GHE9_9PEZI|nr:hypothetical protein B0J12DRAFT_52964 [Macrophomina phaseolina]
MEATFITIHDLTREARILYSSDSIVDILGHTPDEVVGKSCWDFFHQDEIPFAKDFHSRGVKLDKAAVLAYCQIRNRDGDWVGCECCFSVVYDVMVCCTSIYRRGMTSQKRAVEAPIVRKLFSSSPKDPRYHMLSHLSAKFNLGPRQQTHEPRAALFLNRFTRTLTIMYATSGIEQVIGISSEEMKGKSFYYCIQENCLEDAVRVLETAKGNDSIAYLRFHFRDPRVRPNRDTPNASEDEVTDETMTDVTEDEDEGGVDVEGGEARTPPALNTHNSTSTSGMDTDNPSTSTDEARPSSHEAARRAAVHPLHSSASSQAPTSPSTTNGHDDYIELEAVVSCTSDGLVVCLRRARPLMPPSAQPLRPDQPAYGYGIFAAPWAPEPVFLPPLPNAYANAARMGLMAPPQQPTPAGGSEYGGPIAADFMQSIRDVAVFAWALTGINGSLAEYSRGKPKGESQPPDGFPIWNPYGNGDPLRAGSGSSGSSMSGITKDPFGDPGLDGRRFGA